MTDTHDDEIHDLGDRIMEIATRAAEKRRELSALETQIVDLQRRRREILTDRMKEPA